jgi:hypothetical protein
MDFNPSVHSAAEKSEGHGRKNKKKIGVIANNTADKTAELGIDQLMECIDGLGIVGLI